MSKPRRELKNITVCAKITSTLNLKAIKKCEKEGISLSEYINQLIREDLKK